MKTFKAISLHQPYASAIALGLKTYETRHWATKYRGPLLIHAALSNESIERFNVLMTLPWFGDAFKRHGISQWAQMIKGRIVCKCDLLECLPTDDLSQWTQDVYNAQLGNFSEGRFTWKLANVQLPTHHLVVTGRQRFFNVTVPDDLFL